MIQQGEIEFSSQPPQPLGGRDVSIARLRNSGWVIVDENEPGRADSQGAPDDGPEVDLNVAERTVGDPLDPHQPASRIHVERQKSLIFEEADFRLQKVDKLL